MLWMLEEVQIMVSGYFERKASSNGDDANARDFIQLSTCIKPNDSMTNHR